MKFLRLIISLLAMSYATHLPAQSLADCELQACIRVGSFNIELLGSQRKRGGNPISKRSSDDLEELADLIGNRSGFDIVALQEIDTSSSQWRDLKQFLDAHGYSVAIEGTTSARNQFQVLLFKRDTITLEPGSAFEVDVSTSYEFGGGCEYEGLRQPIAAKFTAQAFDFIVISVHLKSRSARGIPDECPDDIRSAQVDELIDAADTLRQQHGDADVILVGDFNAAEDENSLRALADEGYVSQMKFRAVGSGRYSYRKSGNKLIDHIMFNPSATTEFVPRSGFIYLVEDADLRHHVRRLSDHMPVWASFFAKSDDD